MDKKTVYVVYSVDEMNFCPIDKFVLGVYLSRGKAIRECVAYIKERLENREDIREAFHADENHSEVEAMHMTDDELLEFVKDTLGSDGYYNVDAGDLGVTQYDIVEKELDEDEEVRI